MKSNVGVTLGLVLAAAGIVFGVYFAWQGFSSAPYNVKDFGIFCGSIGALVGLSTAAIAALAGRCLDSSSNVPSAHAA